MKSIATIFVVLIFSAATLAQSSFSTKLSLVLEKVIQDHLKNYRDIKGGVIVQRPQLTEYKSTVFVPGASSCVITHSNISGNDQYSWSCVLLESGNYDQVQSKFNETYQQLSNSIIKLQGEKPYILTGKYEKPVEQKNYSKIYFDLIPSIGETKKLKVELSLVKENAEWKLLLSVHDQDLV